MAGHAVKVMGTGLVTSLGNGVAEVYGAMCRGETGFRPLTRFDSEPYAQKAGGQLNETLESRIRDRYPDDDLSVGMMKLAGEEALGKDSENGGLRLGLVLGTNFGPMETLEWAWRERLDTGSLDEESYNAYGHVLAQVAAYFGCSGPRVQLSMSCASGAAAVSAGCDMILADRADRVLVLAYDSLTETCWCGLSNLRTVTTDTMRPFDVKRSGTIFSEGAAAMVLGKAELEGPCLGWVSGWATNNNAYHMTAPRKNAEGSRQVMLEAIRQAGLTADDVEQLCAHATSTHANDETEAGAFRNLFGERLAEIPVTAYKSQLGHMLGGAGLAEAVLTLEAMRAGMLPPVVNLTEKDPACEPVNCGEGKARMADFSVAVTNSAGIGGNNSALVLTRRASDGVCLRDIDCLYVKALGWVLPAGIGAGTDLLSHPEWLVASGDGAGALEGFSARNYVTSVKGYLDPGGAFALAAFSLAHGGCSSALDKRRGICTCTRYGACRSAYGFFEQLVRKGARFASPMIFPHGYASAAGNLAAMEFGWGGPHMVHFGEQDISELLEYALARLRDGSATEMMVGAYEGTVPAAVPDGTVVLNGALALRVSAESGPDDVAVLPVADWRRQGPFTMEFGSVQALGSLLCRLG